MEDLPSKSTGRVAMEKIVEGTISAVPVIGGPLAVVFATAVGWSLSKRTDDWLTTLAEEVDRLGLLIADLADDPTFVDAVVTATRAAQATHQQEKLEALRNGVLHSIGPDAPDVDEQARFFRLVSEFTAGHLQLLALLNDPEGTYNRLGLPIDKGGMFSSRAALIGRLPGFEGRPDWYGLLFSDLSNAQLMNAGSMNTSMTAGGAWQPVTTDLGRRFLGFISAP